MRLCAGKGGVPPPADPASVPTVSEPQPTMPLVNKYSMVSAVGPGECGPVASALRNSASVALRLYQSVRIKTHDPDGIAPWAFSQALTPSTVRRKSGFFAVSAEQSMTHAGATNLWAGMRSVVPSTYSLPVIQCTGAAK